ncbi:hypothetical protein BJY04DRAFT_229213 [Aspergillus karnatakaensis]|uniref:uncharacterized protein n=1 Tax=Aspergillus karnatakaensis TaxID=1810916 RepID=UPI003CCD4B48
MCLDSLPEEIISLVLQSCDSFYQLRTLISTSKTIHTAWKDNQRSILWKVGETAVPGFTDALIAVRATNIAQNSILRGELPLSPFPTAHLSGTKHLEAKTRNPRDKKPAFLPHKWYFDSLSWGRSTWETWREGYHRAIYRYLTAGAVLCRSYYEPILSKDRPKGFLSSLVGLLEGVPIQGSDGEGEYSAWFSEPGQRYLKTIHLYDSQQHESWGEAFQSLEEIFLTESRKQSQQPAISPPKQPQNQKSLYNTFSSNGKNHQSLDSTHAETLFTQLLQFLYLVDGDIRCQISLPGDSPSENTSEPLSDTLTCFLFGSFTLMNINIRRCPTCKTSSAFASPILPKLTTKTLQSTTTTDKEFLGFSNMHNYLKKVWDVSGIPNCYGDPIRKTPPPIAFFVEYMLRKYFGLRFATGMFDSTREIRCAWFAFHQFGGVFTGFAPGLQDEGNGVRKGSYVGQDLLESVDVPRPIVVYDEYAWYY